MDGKEDGETNQPKTNFYFDKDELRKMFREACDKIEADKKIQQSKEKTVVADDDMFEQAKEWALSQKKNIS